ncbi:sensor histidine kinase [Actinomadura flavalba]|uniref:sensor histidine kinase n=1 Tax=Actinomadura flavalba TaxID=1120938 RepID=UPI0003709123|nr:histidine kinase [Actinomadura flavalba]
MTEHPGGLERVHTVGGCVVRVAIWGGASLYLLACVLTYGLGPREIVLYAVAAAATIGALLPRHLSRWAAGVAGASLLLTGALAFSGMHDGNPAVVPEACGLLLLALRVAWKAPRDRLVPLTTLLGSAVVLLPLRGGLLLPVLLSAPLAVLVAVAVGAGLYGRALDERRARSLTAARRDERLDLARDLHDFVAHHVTGIVVQAQAARFAAGSGAAQSPEQLDTMLAGIEQAGGEALTSMRRMVGLLRDAQDAPAATPRRTGLDAVADLTDAFTSPPAALFIAPDLGTPPPEIATTIHRVVQESLTNVRKHAADATTVHVMIERRDGAYAVQVTDDGQGRGRRLPAGGFGLAGLDERIAALGGRLMAGPGPAGGWTVTAVLPAR